MFYSETNFKHASIFFSVVQFSTRDEVCFQISNMCKMLWPYPFGLCILLVPKLAMLTLRVLCEPLKQQLVYKMRGRSDFWSVLRCFLDFIQPKSQYRYVFCWFVTLQLLDIIIYSNVVLHTLQREGGYPLSGPMSMVGGTPLEQTHKTKTLPSLILPCITTIFWKRYWDFLSFVIRVFWMALLV